MAATTDTISLSRKKLHKISEFGSQFLCLKNQVQIQWLTSTTFFKEIFTLTPRHLASKHLDLDTFKNQKNNQFRYNTT